MEVSLCSGSRKIISSGMEDSEWHKKGDKWRDYRVQVVGHGIDKTTGKPLNFVSFQTGQ